MKKFNILCILLGFSGACMSQSTERQVLAAAGMSASAGTIQADWTIGETVTLSQSTANLTVNQGFNLNTGNLSSVKLIDAAQLFTIYPNPTTGIINMDAKAAAGNMTVIIYDLSGKQVTALSWNPGSTLVIDGSSWAAGLYTLNILSNDATAVYRLSKL